MATAFVVHCCRPTRAVTFPSSLRGRSSGGGCPCRLIRKYSFPYQSSLDLDAAVLRCIDRVVIVHLLIAWTSIWSCQENEQKYFRPLISTTSWSTAVAPGTRCATR